MQDKYQNTHVYIIIQTVKSQEIFLETAKKKDTVHLDNNYSRLLVGNYISQKAME